MGGSRFKSEDVPAQTSNSSSPSPAAGSPSSGRIHNLDGFVDMFGRFDPTPGQAPHAPIGLSHIQRRILRQRGKNTICKTVPKPPAGLKDKVSHLAEKHPIYAE